MTPRGCEYTPDGAKLAAAVARNGSGASERSERATGAARLRAEGASAGSAAFDSDPPDDAAQVGGSADERFLLVSRPALQLTLARQRVFRRRIDFRMNDPDRTPARRVSGPMSRVVQRLSRSEIVCLSDVQRAVSAPE